MFKFLLTLPVLWNLVIGTYSEYRKYDVEAKFMRVIKSPGLNINRAISAVAQDYYYQPRNVTRTTLSGLAAYRSALTLDWLAAEDSRQRDLVAAFVTDEPPARFISSDCVTYPKPAPGKVARLMLELIRNLEGDEGTVIPDLIQVLVRTKLLVETSALEAEPDFEALVKTHGLMVGEPHSTLPKIVAVVWMLVTDPVTTRKYGWCPVQKVNKYLAVAKPGDIAKHMRALEVVVARARFVMEEFIQTITPVNMYQTKRKLKNTPKRAGTSKLRRLEKRPPAAPISYSTARLVSLESMQSPGLPEPAAARSPAHPARPSVIDGSLVMLANGERIIQVSKILLACVCFEINLF